MSARLKFTNGTVRPQFKLIADIDEESIKTGFANSVRPLFLPDDYEDRSADQNDRNKKFNLVVVRPF